MLLFHDDDDDDPPAKPTPLFGPMKKCDLPRRLVLYNWRHDPRPKAAGGNSSRGGTCADAGAEDKIIILAEDNAQ